MTGHDEQTEALVAEARLLEIRPLAADDLWRDTPSYQADLIERLADAFERQSAEVAARERAAAADALDAAAYVIPHAIGDPTQVRWLQARAAAIRAGDNV